MLNPRFCSVKKGEQVFYCYGRRTSGYLLLNYGFCFPDNKYNSVKFKVLCQEDRKGRVGRSAEELGEVRLKKNRLSIDLINKVRKATLKRYAGHKKDRLAPDRPTDGEFEIYVLSLCCNLLKEYYLHRFKTSVLDDKKLLAEKTVRGRLRFAIAYRLEAKEIVVNNMHLFELLIQILGKAATEPDFKKAYMTKFDMLENEAAFYKNRRLLRGYLRSFYYYARKGK